MNAGGRPGAWAARPWISRPWISRTVGAFAVALLAGCAAGNSVETIVGDSGLGGDATLDGTGSGDEGGGKTDGPSTKDGTTGNHPDAGHDTGAGDAHHDGETTDGAVSCIAPQEKCGSTCTNTSEDPQNCGTCGHACASGLVCASGTCAAGCPPGQLRCGADGGTVVVDASSDADASAPAGDAGAGMNPGGQYCADPTNDRLNCGTCDNICPSGPHSTPVCSGSACSITCDPNYADCNGKASDGCEVETNNNPASCGACGVVCAQVNDTASCIMGVCGIASCNAGFANCDGNARNGCETSTNNVNNCGACGVACNIPNGSAGCPAGSCTVQACNTGYGDCNNMASDGCETATTSSVGNCGGCGSVCTTANATPACVGSKCTVVSCNAGFADCDGLPGDGCEVNIKNNANNCGTCGNVCSLAHASAAGCAAGMCVVLACDPGYGDCNGLPADGCETPLNTVGDCGTCGHVCPTAGLNDNPTCTAAGACAIGSCDPGFADCDGQAANGCEVNLNTNTNDCGTCGHVCSESNGTSKCVGGGCAVNTCNAGYADCDGNEANGCEVNTTNDTNDCGACGRICETTCGGPGDEVLQATCTASVCGVSSCDAGYTDFDKSCGNGCECKSSAVALTTCSSAQALFGGTLTPPGQITTVVSTMAPPATTTDAYYTLNFGGNTTYTTYHPIITISSPNNEFQMDVWSGCGEAQAMTTCTDNGASHGTNVLQFEETYTVNPGWATSEAEWSPLPVLSVVVHVHRRAGAPATCNAYTINASND